MKVQEERISEWEGIVSHDSGEISQEELSNSKLSVTLDIWGYTPKLQWGLCEVDREMRK